MATYTIQTAFFPLINRRLEGGLKFHFDPPLRSNEDLQVQIHSFSKGVHYSEYIVGYKYEVVTQDGQIRTTESYINEHLNKIELPKNTKSLEFYLVFKPTFIHSLDDVMNQVGEYDYFDINSSVLTHPTKWREFTKTKVDLTLTASPQSESLPDWGSRRITVDGHFPQKGIGYLYPSYLPNGNLQWYRLRMRFVKTNDHFQDLSLTNDKFREKIRTDKAYHQVPLRVSMLNLDGSLYDRQKNMELLKRKRQRFYQDVNNEYPSWCHGGIWSHPLGESYLNVSYLRNGNTFSTTAADVYINDDNLYINNHTGKKRQTVFNPFRMNDGEPDASTVNLVLTQPSDNHLSQLFNSYFPFTPRIPGRIRTIIDEMIIGVEEIDTPNQSLREKAGKTWLSVSRPHIVDKYLVRIAIAESA